MKFKQFISTNIALGTGQPAPPGTVVLKPKEHTVSADVVRVAIFVVSDQDVEKACNSDLVGAFISAPMRNLTRPHFQLCVDRIGTNVHRMVDPELISPEDPVGIAKQDVKLEFRSVSAHVHHNAPIVAPQQEIPSTKAALQVPEVASADKFQSFDRTSDENNDIDIAASLTDIAERKMGTNKAKPSSDSAPPPQPQIAASSTTAAAAPAAAAAASSISVGDVAGDSGGHVVSTGMDSAGGSSMLLGEGESMIPQVESVSVIDEIPAAAQQREDEADIVKKNDVIPQAKGAASVGAPDSPKEECLPEPEQEQDEVECEPSGELENANIQAISQPDLANEDAGASSSHDAGKNMYASFASVPEVAAQQELSCESQPLSQAAPQSAAEDDQTISHEASPDFPSVQSVESMQNEILARHASNDSSALGGNDGDDEGEAMMNMNRSFASAMDSAMGASQSLNPQDDDMMQSCIQHDDTSGGSGFPMFSSVLSTDHPIHPVNDALQSSQASRSRSQEEDSNHAAKMMQSCISAGSSVEVNQNVQFGANGRPQATRERGPSLTPSVGSISCGDTISSGQDDPIHSSSELVSAEEGESSEDEQEQETHWLLELEEQIELEFFRKPQVDAAPDHTAQGNFGDSYEARQANRKKQQEDRWEPYAEFFRDPPPFSRHVSSAEKSVEFDSSRLLHFIPYGLSDCEQKPKMTFTDSNDSCQLYQAVRVTPDLATGHVNVQLRPLVAAICPKSLVSLQKIGDDMSAAVAAVVGTMAKKDDQEEQLARGQGQPRGYKMVVEAPSLRLDVRLHDDFRMAIDLNTPKIQASPICMWDDHGFSHVAQFSFGQVVGYFIDEGSLNRDPFCPPPKWSISREHFPNRVEGMPHCIKLLSTDNFGGRVLVLNRLNQQSQTPPKETTSIEPSRDMSASPEATPPEDDARNHEWVQINEVWRPPWKGGGAQGSSAKKKSGSQSRTKASASPSPSKGKDWRKNREFTVNISKDCDTEVEVFISKVALHLDAWALLVVSEVAAKFGDLSAQAKIEQDKLFASGDEKGANNVVAKPSTAQKVNKRKQKMEELREEEMASYPFAFELSVRNVAVEILDSGECSVPISADLCPRATVADLNVRFVQTSATLVKTVVLARDVRFSDMYCGRRVDMALPWFETMLEQVHHPMLTTERVGGGHNYLSMNAGDWKSTHCLVCEIESRKLGGAFHSNSAFRINRMVAHLKEMLYSGSVDRLAHFLSPPPTAQAKSFSVFVVNLVDVLMHIKLPDASELEAIRKCKSEDTNSNLPLLDLLVPEKKANSQPTSPLTQPAASSTSPVLPPQRQISELTDQQAEQNQAPFKPEWRMVAHISKFDLTCGLLVGTEAQGLRAELQKFNLFLSDHPSHLSQLEIISRAHSPNNFLSSWGYALIFDTAGITAIWRTTSLKTDNNNDGSKGSGTGLRVKPATKVTLAGSGDDVTRKMNAKVSKLLTPSRQAMLDVEIESIGGYCCSDTMQALTNVVSDCIELVAPDAKNRKLEAVEQAIEDEIKQEIKFSEFTSPKRDNLNAASGSAEKMRSVSPLPEEIGGGAAAASREPSAKAADGEAAAAAQSGGFTASPFQSLIMEDYLTKGESNAPVVSNSREDHQMPPQLSPGASASRRDANASFHTANSKDQLAANRGSHLQRQQSDDSQVAMCLLDPKAFSGTDLQRLKEQDERARREINDAIASAEKHELGNEMYLSGLDGAVAEPTSKSDPDVQRREGSALRWLVAPGDVSVVHDHMVGGQRNESLQAEPTPQSGRRDSENLQTPSMIAILKVNNVNFTLYGGTDFEQDSAALTHMLTENQNAPKPNRLNRRRRDQCITMHMEKAEAKWTWFVDETLEEAALAAVANQAETGQAQDEIPDLLKQRLVRNKM